MCRRIKSIICILLMAVMILPEISMVAHAAGTTLEYSVTYDQSGARKMLDKVNKLRSDNGKSQLAYDYELEKLAMKRAAELAVIFEHERPDGSGTVVNIGENIAYGYSSMGSAYDAFLGSDKIGRASCRERV